MLYNFEKIRCYLTILRDIIIYYTKSYIITLYSYAHHIQYTRYTIYRIQYIVHI